MCVGKNIFMPHAYLHQYTWLLVIHSVWYYCNEDVAIFFEPPVQLWILLRGVSFWNNIQPLGANIGQRNIINGWEWEKFTFFKPTHTKNIADCLIHESIGWLREPHPDISQCWAIQKIKPYAYQMGSMKALNSLLCRLI